MDSWRIEVLFHKSEHFICVIITSISTKFRYSLTNVESHFSVTMEIIFKIKLNILPVFHIFIAVLNITERIKYYKVLFHLIISFDGDYKKPMIHIYLHLDFCLHSHEMNRYKIDLLSKWEIFACIGDVIIIFSRRV